MTTAARLWVAVLAGFVPQLRDIRGWRSCGLFYYIIVCLFVFDGKGTIVSYEK